MNTLWRFFAFSVALLSLTTLPRAIAAESYPCPQLLVQPDDLAKSIAEFVILDARDVASYAELHIEDARWVDVAAWSEAMTKNSGSDEDTLAWSARIAELGIDKHSNVVVYDNDRSQQAAQVWWLLRHWGVKNVALLNGGWLEWRKARRPLGAGTAEPPAATDFQAMIANRVSNPAPQMPPQTEPQTPLLKTQLINALSDSAPFTNAAQLNAYLGKTSNLIQLDKTKLLDSQTERFHSATDLAKLFADAKLDLTKPIRVYSPINNPPCLIDFTLQLMGAKDVQIEFPVWSEIPDSGETSSPSDLKK